MKPGEVVIHLLDPDAISAENAFAILNEVERRRAERFRSESDGLRWSSFRAQMRIILGRALNLAPLEVPLIFSEFGKPLLAPPYDGLHFNLSHCADLGLIGLCLDGPIGVDIEPQGRDSDLSECESIFCHPLEIQKLPENGLERAKRLLEIWTAKEALLKALGTGLMHHPESVQVSLANGTGTATSDTIVQGIADFRIKQLDHQRLMKYRTMVAVPHSVRFVRIQ